MTQIALFEKLGLDTCVSHARARDADIGRTEFDEAISGGNAIR